MSLLNCCLCVLLIRISAFASAFKSDRGVLFKIVNCLEEDTDEDDEALITGGGLGVTFDKAGSLDCNAGLDITFALTFLKFGLG